MPHTSESTSHPIVNTSCVTTACETVRFPGSAPSRTPLAAIRIDAPVTASARKLPDGLRAKRTV